MSQKKKLSIKELCFDTLEPALERLDRLLEQAITRAENIYGAEAALNPNRGLYLDEEEIERLLARQAGRPLFQINQDCLPDLGESESRWSRLRQSFELTDFDLDLILIALASEVDLRYERLYAYLQDDVTRRRPTVDLALNLLCVSSEEKIRRRSHLEANAPLIRQDLLQLIPDPNQVTPPFLAHYLKLDEQIVHFMLGQSGLNQLLMPFSLMVIPSVQFGDLFLEIEVRRLLQDLTARSRETNQPLKLYLQGLPGIGKRQIAEAIALELDSHLLIVDLVRALNRQVNFIQALRLVQRETLLRKVVLYIPGIDQLSQEEIIYQQLLEKLAELTCTIILSGAQPWMPITPNHASIRAIPLSIPDLVIRRACWETQLTKAGFTLDETSLNELADRFQLTPEQIASAVTLALHSQGCSFSSSSENLESTISPSVLFSAARAQSGYELKGLATKLTPSYSWKDIVLPPDPLAQLQEICTQVKYRHIVYEEWGFEEKLSLGKGLNALFSGSSGTGKTMAGEVIANDLQLDLYRIDLSQVVSKYIGETEKNLERIFRAAEMANAILFFDEADALFGKRSQVKDAHDRYANIEIGYLLQKMEEYEGIAILATNLRQNMDEAFVRRIQVIIEFPFPDEEYRRYIWQRIFPAKVPIAENVNFDKLACQVRLAGGNIKNIALLAAFYAAAADKVICWNHLVQAIRREYQKLGISWNEEEWDL